MEWLLVIAAIIAFFFWQGFRTRCPACGDSALHSRDTSAETKLREHYEGMKSTGLLQGLDSAGSSLGTERNKPGYANRRLRCKKCGQSFNRRTAVIWLTTANKFGEDVAIREYQKLRNENADT